MTTIAVSALAFLFGYLLGMVSVVWLILSRVGERWANRANRGVL
ncbi:MAG: hypothetical protein ACE147_00795 [Candidatus Methylomirabilales bacterium]